MKREQDREAVEKEISRITEKYNIPKERAQKWQRHIGTVEEIDGTLGNQAPETERYLRLIQKRDKLLAKKREIHDEVVNPVRSWVNDKYRGYISNTGTAEERIRYEQKKKKLIRNEVLPRYDPWIDIQIELQKVEDELKQIYTTYIERMDIDFDSKKSKIIELKRAFPYLRASDSLIADMLDTTKGYAGQIRKIGTEGITDRTAPKRLKNRALERDEHECVRCHSEENLEVHHIIPRAHGGSNKVENLVVLCHECHLKAHGNVSSYETEGQHSVEDGLIYGDADEFWQWIEDQR